MFLCFLLQKRVNTHDYTLNFEEIVEHKNKWRPIFLITLLA